MKKLWTCLLIVTLLTFTMIGCSKSTDGQESNSNDPAVAQNETEAKEEGSKSEYPTTLEGEIENYVNVELPIFFYLEDLALTPFEEALGINYMNDTQVYTTLTRVVLPAYTEFIDYLKEVEGKLQAPELVELHKTYMDAANTQNEALWAIKASMEAGVEDYFEDANPKIMVASEGFTQWQTGVKDLAEQHNIAIENPYADGETEYAEGYDPLLEEFLKDLLDMDENGGQGNSGDGVSP